MWSLIIFLLQIVNLILPEEDLVLRVVLPVSSINLHSFHLFLMDYYGAALFVIFFPLYPFSHYSFTIVFLFPPYTPPFMFTINFLFAPDSHVESRLDYRSPCFTNYFIWKGKSWQYESWFIAVYNKKNNNPCLFIYIKTFHRKFSWCTMACWYMKKLYGTTFSVFLPSSHFQTCVYLFYISFPILGNGTAIQIAITILWYHHCFATMRTWLSLVALSVPGFRSNNCGVWW